MATVAVVGSGFSGTLMAVHLLRTTDAEITLIERGGRFARGVAYSTAQPEHRLNVRARDMSAFPDQPAHFATWLDEQQAGDPDSFASRGRFGDYLGTLLAQAEAAHPNRLHRHKGEVTALTTRDKGHRLQLASGEGLDADVVVLAVGNLPPHDPPGLSTEALSADVYVADPWGQDLSAGLASDDDVAVIGTGLTMVDVVIELRAAGFRGSVTAISRRGLLPRGHAVTASCQTECEAREIQPATLSQRVGRLRGRADVIGWRGAVDELRPVTSTLWMRASAETRARFLRHLRPWWDVHRHRLAPSVAATVDEALADGGLTVEAGRLLPAVPVEGGVELCWRRRGDDQVQRRRFRRVINCTGPSSNILRTPDPLLGALVAAGAIRPDPLRVGIDVGEGGQAIAADGEPNSRLFVVGPMSRGAYWEIIAVPDIRVQVQAVAAEVAAAIAA